MNDADNAAGSTCSLRLNRFLAHWFPDYPFLLRQSLRGCRSILDVGCGGALSPLRAVPRLPGQWRTGVDGFLPSLEESRAASIHDEYIRADLRSFVAEPGNREGYDCVLALDVIEHFPKRESTAFVTALEAIARLRVILFTPNGFLPQEPRDGNEYQRHLCGWTAPELVRRGYRVYGCGGPKPLRGEFAVPVLRPRIFGAAVARALQPLVFYFPTEAFALFAVKDT